MEIRGGEEEGFVREWTPCTHMLSLIPPRVQNGLFSNELCLTCIDAVSEYIALGTNFGLVYWYDRKKGNIQRLRCEATTSSITFVKIVDTVDYMVGAGNAAGQVTVFQIPKEHPDNVPEMFKPKVERKVERYTIGDLHKSQVTAIEWSKNGMRLFSGDKDGVIIMTEVDFYMHLCKSQEIVNEQHEIVQLSYHQNRLLVSSVYRTIICERSQARWLVNQVGTKERKSLCALGGVWSGAAAYCGRRGARLWRADTAGTVLQTLLFKEAISNPLTVVELLNPCQQRVRSEEECNFGPLHPLREHFLVTHCGSSLYVLDPRSLTAVAAVDQLRKILSVCVNKEEIFVVEGPRSVVRLAGRPEPGAMLPDDPLNLMTKSLTSSLQHAVNTVRDFTHFGQTVPFIASVLEQPISILTNNEFIETGAVSRAEEAVELPPIRDLTDDITGNVLESIVNEFRDTTAETEELRRVRSEELQRKLKLYNSIAVKECEGELIHSRRSKKRGGSGTSTPRHVTPVRTEGREGREGRGDGVSYTSPCLMNMSVYGNIPQEPDDILAKQIEEKEKILAKMLNLESLSIITTDTHSGTDDNHHHNYTVSTKHNVHPVVPYPKQDILITPIKQVTSLKPEIVLKKPVNVVKKISQTKEPDPPELVPKLVRLPNNWNLGDIQLKFESNGDKNGDGCLSPDDHIETDWEFV